MGHALRDSSLSSTALAVASGFRPRVGSCSLVNDLMALSSYVAKYNTRQNCDHLKLSGELSAENVLTRV